MNQQVNLTKTANIAVKIKKGVPTPIDDAALDVEMTELHPAVLVLSLALYVYMMGVYWLLFYSRVDSAFMVGVSTGFLLVYAGTPLAMVRVGGLKANGRSFGEFLRGRMMTNTGSLKGWEAMVQVITIPVALALTTTGIGFAILRTV